MYPSKINFFIAIVVGILNANALYGHDLVDVRTFEPSIIVDIRYSTPNNFFGFPVQPSDHIFVDSYIASRLGRVQRDLAKEGVGLIVHQGYRSPSVQKQIECYCPYVGHEHCTEEAPHFRKGLGVDVSIYYLSGLPLKLPTHYGDVSAAAYRDYPFCCATSYHNRYLLEKYMTLHGFVPQRERWWHFDLKGWEFAPDLEIEYEEILNNK